MTRRDARKPTWVPFRRWLCQVALGDDSRRWVGGAMFATCCDARGFTRLNLSWYSFFAQMTEVSVAWHRYK
jgi:hypothetical protein